MVNPRSLPGRVQFLLALVIGAVACVLAVLLDLSDAWIPVFGGFVIAAVFVMWEAAATRAERRR